MTGPALDAVVAECYRPGGVAARALRGVGLPQAGSRYQTSVSIAMGARLLRDHARRGDIKVGHGLLMALGIGADAAGVVVRSADL